LRNEKEKSVKREGDEPTPENVAAPTKANRERSAVKKEEEKVT